MSTITIYASCHCKTFDTSFSIPASKFPLKSSVCHCNICRYTSGHAFGTFGVIPLPYSETPSTRGLVGYRSSEKLTRWFCEKCGAKCWNDDRTAGDQEADWEWEIYVGLVDRVEVDGQPREEIMTGLLDRVQIWLHDTTDGGASIWVNGGVLEGMDRRMVGRQSKVVNDEDIQSLQHEATQINVLQDAVEVAAGCHCQSIRLSITMKDSDKYEAGLDACESCRKVTGSEITAWATVPTKHIRFSEGDQLDLKSDRFGKYSTSDGVLRIFCKGCGATIFYQKLGEETTDIAVGLFRAHGVRVEGLLDWHKYGSKRVAYQEDAVDRVLVERLVLGFNRQSEQDS